MTGTAAGNPDPEVNHAYHMEDLPNSTVNAQGGRAV